MRIIDARFLKSLTKAGDRKGISLPEICFVGRSNVGKSSLLNALVGRKTARTGSTPGATRLINLYGVRSESNGRRNEMIFSDFPGFGYSKVSKGIYENWQAMVEGYMIGNEWIRRVFWAFDIRRSFDDLDRMLLEWLNDNGLAFSLVLTKADKEGRDGQARALLSFQRLLGMEDVFLFSAKDGSGRKELLAHIGDILR
ncbi:MAG: ribosome biogenesis GTP-binding protein YihA/YsxC [Syntrophorhabdales bacterium]|jgi:GTP-binding protein